MRNTDKRKGYKIQNQEHIEDVIYGGSPTYTEPPNKVTIDQISCADNTRAATDAGGSGGVGVGSNTERATAP